MNATEGLAMRPGALQKSRRSARVGAPDRPASVGLRLRVRFRRWRLDHELADASPRAASEDWALRARQLAHPITCRELARSLRHLLASAEDPGAVRLSSSVPVVREVVMSWREALLGVAEHLERSTPVNARGVARVQVLVTDGAGPLYNPAPDRSMREAIWWVADGLALCRSHDWRCPVIMKLDPEHVGWTCARCGAIATSDDPAVRPA
jgi:hypothetical protein